MNKQEIETKHIQMEFDFDQFRPNIRIQKYQIFNEIGGGDQAKVYQGRNTQTNLYVAVKVIDKRIIEKQPNFNLKKKRRRLTEEESRNMMMINSDYVLKCYECYQSKNYKLMFIEYCRQGSLLDCLQQRERFPEYQAKTYLKQIINGLSKCHQKKIMHRDLKLQNIFLHHGICKIADFGFSKLLAVEDEQEMVKNTILGNIDSMAPQVIFKEQYGLKADIWGLGVIFSQMITGRKPFAYKITLSDEIKKYLTVRISQINKSITIFGIKPSPEVKKFFKDVFVIDPKNRMGWKQLLQHQIFKIKQQKLHPTYIRPTDLNQSVEIIQSKAQQFQQQSSQNDEENEDQMVQQNLSHLDLSSKQYKVKKVHSFFMNEEQVIQAKQNINRKQDIIYQWGKFIHTQCFRAEYIFEKIIKQIEKYELLDLTQLVPLRTMFLLCNRCRNYISPINSEYNKNKTIKILNQLNFLVNKLYKDITERWNFYDRKLGLQEALNNIRKKEVVYNQYSEEFKFFNGFEDMREYRPEDWKKSQLCNQTRQENLQEMEENQFQLILVSYTKNEQIDFTQRFIDPMIMNLKQSEVTGQVQSYMKGFRKICTERFDNPEELQTMLERMGNDAKLDKA